MKAQKIARVTAIPLNVPMHVTLAGADKRTSLACVHVEVETTEGIVGHGVDVGSAVGPIGVGTITGFVVEQQ